MKALYSTCIDTYKNDGEENLNLFLDYLKTFNITESTKSVDDFSILLAELHKNKINLLFDIESFLIDDSNIRIPNILENTESESSFIRKYFAEIVLSKYGETQYDFSTEDEYNKIISEVYESIDLYKDYIRKVLEKLYSVNENKIEKMSESIVKIEEKITKYLVYV